MADGVENGRTEDRAEPRRGVRLSARMRLFWRRVLARLNSSLTRRIVLLNLAGLAALFVGFLYLNQFREGLIEARVQSLLIQGEIIAGAIASSATVDTDTIRIDPDKLLELQLGESVGGDDALSPLQFSINPERVAPILRRLVTPTRTRARIYDPEGGIVIDSRQLYTRGDILRLDLPPVGQEEEQTLFERGWSLLRGRLGRADLPRVEDIGLVNGRRITEVARALEGQSASVVRVNAAGETIVSVAVPIQRLRVVRGALLLSTQGGDIDAIIAKERIGLLEVFAIAALVMLLLSVLLANGIAEPIRRLADAADRVKRGVKSRHEIPDFSGRADEIGHLSGALREMTDALYRRIDAIESFAADVAHELKNPLTSLRSAVETLPLARNEASRSRLMDVIQHDVRRLDRLISDISDASRLDAELARSDEQPVDVVKLLEAVIRLANEVRRPDQAAIILEVDEPQPPERERKGERQSDRPGERAARFKVLGHDSRLGQVVTNLIDNARSFSPPDAPVRVVLSRVGTEVEIAVEDEGPGIPAHALERIFERFYTDRPAQGFGQNSGLGLSISRQIVEAHRGRIWAENRLGSFDAAGERERLGARFVVRLPALS